MHLSSQASPGIETNATQSAPVQEEEMRPEGGVGYAGDGRVLKPGATLSSGAGIFEDLKLLRMFHLKKAQTLFQIFLRFHRLKKPQGIWKTYSRSN
jgi:hypothetical protein